ncbi:AAA family ATPase [Bacillus cereus]|uniref:AAA family ATPase n=1 Tax=Bacillus cereus TaxID=1396 RepID=UPI001BDAA1AE|nr:AAA family ATPase [Bacillus cereus]MBT0788173.1 AAA family ATPase [Bacillus cereus]
MKIVYLWVRTLEDSLKVNFNFGSPYIFDFDDQNLILTASPNHQYIEDLYKVNKLEMDINAIVGENGTGKSTILEVIRKIMNGQMEDEFIIMTKDGERYNYTSNIKFYFSNFKPIRTKKHFKRINRIFLTNVLDPQYFHQNSSESNMNIDLSSNNLLLKSKFVDNYFRKELDYQIKFVKKYTNSEIGRIIQIPNSITFRINSNFNNSVIFTVPIRKKIQEIIRMNNFNQMFPELTNSVDFKNFYKIFYKSFYRNLFYLYFFEMDHCIQKYFNDVDWKKRNTKITDTLQFAISSSIAQINIDSKFDLVALNTLIIKKLEENNLEAKFIKNLSHYMITVLDNIHKIELYLQPKKIREFGGLQVSIPVMSLDDEFYRLFERFSIFNLGAIMWTKISSGEYSFLSIFSRLDRVVGQIDFSKKKLLTLIQIDEGELYFHPQWQKQWLNTLLEGVVLIFKDIQHPLQFLLTTHSPFILSDLSSDRVCFLKKDKSTGKIETVNQVEDMSSTFGANIQQLYTNSFFLKGSLMGDFAKKKINELANEIINNKPNYVLKNSEIIAKKIQIIGEPILKQKLLTLYEQQIKLAKPTQQMISEEINLLKERLSKLEDEFKKR